MSKRVKKETAGNLVRMSCYTMQLPQDSGKARAEKTKLSSAARSKMNAITSWNKCRLTMSANFSVGDLFVELTYSDQTLPKNREVAQKQLRRWIDRMRKEYQRYGQKLRYIYTTENKHGEGRYHHHLLMNRIDNAKEILQSHWKNGHIQVDFVDDPDMSRLGQYFTKEGKDGCQRLGQQTWTPSRGLKKPIVETMIVPDSFTLTVPVNCMMLNNPSGRNAYGEYSYLEYLTPTKQVKRDAEGAGL